jgi:uncharacterized protein (DUF1501 family)
MSTSSHPGTPDSGAPCGCDEFRHTGLTRRTLLGSAALAGVLLGSGGQGEYAVAYGGRPAAARSLAGSVLLVLSLRGAADGLSLVVPHADPAYHRARPRIAVPTSSLLVPDAMFGLHPAMAPLLDLWNSGRLAAVHATGMPVPNRSHFSAMEEIEDAAPGSRTRNGWLNRLLGELPGASPLQGTAIGNQPPAALFGPQPAFVLDTVEGAEIGGDDERGRRTAALRHAWPAQGAMGTAVRNALKGVGEFAPARAVPAGRPTPKYPDSTLGRALSEASRVIRGQVGVEVVTVDQGDWDMHTDMGNLEWGSLRSNVDDLATSIAAFFADLGPVGDRVTLVTLSEFGRRVRENDNWGTDHGHGNVMFVAGAGVRGGYHGTWRELTDTLDADVPVTTDYRSVLSEVVTRRFGVSTAQVFPGFRPEQVGVMV